MSSALSNSVTLDDVMAVVSSRRVPIAPELAGYLVLEIAEGGAAASSDIDGKSVFIGDEGTVAVVTPKGKGDGDGEGSLRKILARLLEASGSQTPALLAAAKKSGQGNLGALVEELEAALIPVNRAAGRRALARLSREVKRIMLGVGRNAQTAAPPAAPAPAPAAPRAPPPRAAIPKIPEPRAPNRGPAGSDRLEPPPREKPRLEAPAARAPREEPKASPEAAQAVGLAPSLLLGANPRTSAAADAAPAPPTLDAKQLEFGKEDIDELLKTFEVSDQKPDVQMARDLKAMAGLDPTPPPPNAQLRGDDVLDDLLPPASGDDGGLDSLLAMTSEPPAAVHRSDPPPPPPPAAELEEPKRPLIRPRSSDRPPPLTSDRPTAPVPPMEPEPTARPSSRPPPPLAAPPAAAAPPPAAERSSRRADTVRSTKGSAPGEFTRPRAPKTGRMLLLGMLIALGVGTAAVYFLYPAFFSGKRTPTAKPTAPKLDAPKCKATLTVKGAPADSEILLRVGQAPLDVPGLPMGTRIEFVATAEGYAPKRGVVVPSAMWDPGADQKPRFELPIELPQSKAKANVVDPWPPAEAGTQVGGKGKPGTVHIVSSPRGAEIWLLAGLGPEATYEPLGCETDIEVLVAGPTTFRKRLKVAPDEIAKAPEGKEPGTRLVLRTVQ